MTNRKENGMGNVSGGMSNSVSKMSNSSRKMSNTSGEMSTSLGGMSNASSGASSIMSNGTMNEGAIQHGGNASDSGYDTDESILDQAVQRPGSIKWSPTKKVHLVKNEHGRFGFSCKQKGVS